jgi:hypothetical protein
MGACVLSGSDVELKHKRASIACISGSTRSVLTTENRGGGEKMGSGKKTSVIPFRRSKQEGEDVLRARCTLP